MRQPSIQNQFPLSIPRRRKAKRVIRVRTSTWVGNGEKKKVKKGEVRICFLAELFFHLRSVFPTPMLPFSLSLSLSLSKTVSFVFFWRRRKFDLLRLYRVCFFFSVVEGAYVATTSYIGFIRHRNFKYFIYCLRNLTVCQRCTTKMILFIYLIWLGVWSTEK